MKIQHRRRSTVGRRWAAAIGLAATLTSSARAADAFCGFYISGADAKLFNNATMVVMMRDGIRTVLSMQNNYEGPPADFAMVVPVPVVLQEENVKTLPREVFTHIDQLAAPRLVEYWEQDPCAPEDYADEKVKMGAPRSMARPPAAPGAASLGVTVEAQFSVGEYDILILSAKDSSGLDTYLRENKYKIPQGAEAALRPYVENGMKFFVAKVDVTKVKFDKRDGKDMAMLSPLRFHYDSDRFDLPVRLGLLNSGGKQDLIVHLLAPGKRYEVANYKNVTIPTNLDVAESARGEFGAFYTSLFDRTVEQNPGAVITEYAWDAQQCDPCPGPVLSGGDLMTLGADVLHETKDKEDADKKGKPAAPGLAPPPMRRPGPPGWGGGMGFTLTRLHARYGKESLGEDLVFKEASPITGGREVMSNGKLEHGSSEASSNNFQGRYAIRHAWNGAIACKKPRRGVWGGPPSGQQPAGVKPALDLAFAKRDADLVSFLKQDVPELKISGLGKGLHDLETLKNPPRPKPVKPSSAEDDKPFSDSKSKSPEGACQCRAAGADGDSRAAALGALGLLAAFLLRSKRAR